MKTLFVILTALVTINAHADYKVGDTATYASVFQGQALDLKYDVAAVDVTNDLLKINETIIVSGTVVQTETDDASIAETEMNEKVFDACMQMPAEFKPKYESLTVAAGTFNTCHLTITDQDGTVTNGYFAKILFGIVKMTKEGSSDGSDMSMELKAFKKL